MKIDLHTHTTASDGALTPEALVHKAAAIGLDYLAVTDHDTVAAIASARVAGRACNVQIIPGVEISVTWRRRTIHIVGLHLDVTNAILRDGLKTQQTLRVQRAEKIAHALEQAGVHAPLAQASALATGDLISRTHFAQVLVAQGFASTLQNVFKHYLVPKKPGYASVTWASLAQAVAWITNAGGDAVIAHPARYGLTRSKLLALIADFKQAGGIGIEVACSSHNTHEMHNMADIAKDTQLFASSGSDYHGLEGQWAALGKIAPLPKRCRPIWSRWDLAENPTTSVC